MFFLTLHLFIHSNLNREFHLKTFTLLLQTFSRRFYFAFYTLTMKHKTTVSESSLSKWGNFLPIRHVVTLVGVAPVRAGVG